MSILGYTPNYGFRLVDFSSVPWHDDEYANWNLIDALLSSSLSIPTIDGNWANSTAYSVGDRLYDSVNPNIYQCLIAHTSAATPTTFLTDRTNNPTFWALVTLGMTWKGQWVTATAYQLGDLVFQAGSTYICKVDHTSNVFATDLTAVKWELFAQEGTPGPGSGDVNGPAASVDNRVVQFDGITGKLLKDSGILLAALALLASPAFTGVPVAPTAAPGTNTTQLATTAFIEAAIVALINGAPAALNTLDELAAAIGDDAAFSVTMTNALALKAALASPTFTGTPAAPTAAARTKTTQLATTDFAVSEVNTVAENAQTGTTYTLVLTDAGKMVSMNNASAITLTIPTNASVAFPVGTRIDLTQLGAGQVTVSPTGITLQSNGTKRKLTGQYSGGTLWKRATDTWMLYGDIAA